MSNSQIVLIILTRNAANTIEQQIIALQSQAVKPEEVLFMDTESADNTREIIKNTGFKYYNVLQNEFDHGTTRQLATTLADADIYIFMTQDALPANNDALKKLIAPFFADEKIGCVYGRQLPHKNASVLAAHARAFNYPAVSAIKSYADRNRLGIKTCFNSDSFAAYRKTALQAVGGFPGDVIMGEDVCVAAKMLMNGWKVAYQADAMVYHSHNYTLLEEFNRYFDIGVFHAKNSWILQEFGMASDEGWKYVKSELSYCLKHKAFLCVVQSCVRVWAKFLGYHLGRWYKFIPFALRRKLSMYSFYWK